MSATCLACCNAVIVPNIDMANNKRRNPSVPQRKTSKVPLAAATGSPKSPAPSEQADGSPKPVDTMTNQPKGHSDGKATPGEGSWRSRTVDSKSKVAETEAGAAMGDDSGASPAQVEAERVDSRLGAEQNLPVNSNQDVAAPSGVRTYSIPDYRLESPEFRIFMSGEGSNVEYRIEGDLMRCGTAHSRIEISNARAMH